MSKREVEIGKEKQENTCALCFLDWHNLEYGTKYYLERSEVAFPSLEGSTRWEFVAKQQGKNKGWFAIEVKALVLPKSRRQFVDWTKFFEWVTKDLDCRVKGTFLIIGPPDLALNQNERLQLRSAFVQVILEVAPYMKKNQTRDLGSKILGQFPDWPFTPHVDLKPRARIVKNARELSLLKTSDSGCLIELGISPANIFNVHREEEVAIQRLFNTVSKGVKANKQLGLAKQMGARETVLLLDNHLPYRPDIINHALANLDTELLSNVDKVYLVSVSNRYIADVTPFS